MNKTLKLGGEILDVDTVANAWVSGSRVELILKGINNTVNLKMGTEAAAGRALEEILKAKNGEPAVNVEYEDDSAPAGSGETKPKRNQAVVLAIWFIAGILTSIVIKALT
jgi:hypothetical protein